MEKLSLYEFSDYKKFLLQWMLRAPNKGRGQRKLLADAIGCQTPFITHVLAGDYQFSPEQAEACARWLGLKDSDTEFFLLLVMRQRAGTRGLEATLSKQISQRRAAETVLKKRLNIQDQMTPEDMMVYYSNWHFAAIHMACLIPELQTLEALEKHFRLALPQIIAALEFLTEHRLIEQNRGRFRVLKPVLHLGKESNLLTQHHSQWRLKSIEALSGKKSGDLFYSGIMSLSQEDFDWLRERLSQILEEAITRIQASKNETLAVLNFDWFEL